MHRQTSLSESKRSILQNSGLLNDTVVSPVNVDASVTKTSRKRFALNNFFSRSSLDLGHFNDSKLNTLYQSHYQQTHNGEVICLASIDQNNQLLISPQAIKILKQYEKNSITFIGNIGKKDSGKSFWYDKLLNLSQVQGAQYSKMQSNPGLYIWSIPFVKNNLRIFLLDYSTNKNGQTLTGEDEKLLDLEMILSEALVLVPEPDDKKLKVSESVYSNLNSSMSRLSDKGSKTSKQSAYWPHFFYSLYRSIKAVSQQNDKLSYLFADYNYSIIHNALSGKIQEKVSHLALMESSMVKGQSSSRLLNESYVKRSSLVFQDIYKKLHGKNYEGLAFTGDILPYILTHSAKNLNANKNIKVDKMFNQIKRDIYQSKLEAGKFIYNLNYDPLRQPASPEQNKYQTPQKNKMTDSLKSRKKNDQNIQNAPNETQKTDPNKSNRQIIKVDEGDSPSSQSHLKSLIEESTINAQPQVQKHKPRPLDEVLSIFRRTNENALRDYHEKKYDPTLHEEYEKKLLSYGEAKQKQVLDYNKKQTYNILSSTLPNFTEPKESTELNPQLVLKHIDELKKSGKPLDHDRAKPVAQKLKDVAFFAKKHQFFHVWMTQAHYMQRKLEIATEDKQKELQNLKYNKNALLAVNSVQNNEAEQLKDEHNRSTDKIEKTKSELELSRRLNKNGISDEDYSKELQKHKKRLQDALKQNDRKLRQISLTPSKDPRVNLLEQKLDDKKTMQLQVEAGLSNIIHSRLNNSNSSVLSARKSQIRKIGDGGIKKSYLNKSMTK